MHVYVCRVYLQLDAQGLPLIMPGTLSYVHHANIIHVCVCREYFAASRIAVDKVCSLRLYVWMCVRITCTCSCSCTC
jgi:hypothetical protein